MAGGSLAREKSSDSVIGILDELDRGGRINGKREFEKNAKRTKRLIRLGVYLAPIASGAVTTEKLGDNSSNPGLPDGKKVFALVIRSVMGWEKYTGWFRNTLHFKIPLMTPKGYPWHWLLYLGAGNRKQTWTKHADWVQPKVRTTPTRKGDIRKDEGKLWVSTVENNNAWKPGVYGLGSYESP